MTTKLNFIKGACAVFNCTPGVVLHAVQGRKLLRKWPHKRTKALILKQARSSCNATPAEWDQFYRNASRATAQQALWNLTTGATTKPLPLP